MSDGPMKIKDLPREDLNAYRRWCSQRFRDKQQKLRDPRRLLDGDTAQTNREKARKSYHKRKAEDKEFILSKNRDNVRKVREKKQWTPVQHLVASAIKSVLTPYKAADAAKRKVEYEKRNLLARRMRAYLRMVLKRASAKKAATTMDLVGCTIEEYNKHMQAQLPPGVTMANMSCDHIFPLSMYDLKDKTQQFMANHYSNLQPLLQSGKGGNSSKRNNLPTKAEASKVERWAWPPGITDEMLTDTRSVVDRAASTVEDAHSQPGFKRVRVVYVKDAERTRIIWDDNLFYVIEL